MVLHLVARIPGIAIWLFGTMKRTNAIARIRLAGNMENH